MNETLNNETKKKLIQRAAELLDKYYVFPETGAELAAKIKSQLEARAYAEFTKPSQFGAAVHEDMRSVVNDGHLHLYYHPQQSAMLEEKLKAGDEDENSWWEHTTNNNYGLMKAEILAGNIGYLDIHAFAPVCFGGDRMAAAISFLSDCNALIFDLCECGGGDPFMVQLLESYLFPPEPKLLHTLEDRYKNLARQIWTLPYVPGKRMPDIPVYILTSASTFSGGEDFAYTLKHHGRAKTVGENTKGGAHTVEFLPVGEGFVLVLPTGQSIHPVTNSNWEGTGVAPDIDVPRARALETAHLHALETLSQHAANETKAEYYRAVRRRINIIYNPLVLSEEHLEQFTGVYGSYQALLVDGKLTIASKGQQDVWTCTPLTATRFKVDEDYDGEFELDEDRQVTAFTWIELASGREIRLEKKNETVEI